ncbi:MAG: ribonuclease domain-containing protein [Clostridia bacterium]|nr:ribonuclease domain-containing protein [Clostridia bacterium]
MHRKLLSLALALALALAPLAGCGQLWPAPAADDPAAAEAALEALPLLSAAPEAQGPMETGGAAPADEPAALDEHGVYSAAEELALYLHLYGRLPENFITKAEARALGWEGGGLDGHADGKCIGGDRFGNYEGLLPEAEGRVYYECDVDTLHASRRGAKRIVFSNDGLIYYTEDHYASFTLLYGEEG